MLQAIFLKAIKANDKILSTILKFIRILCKRISKKIIEQKKYKISFTRKEKERARKRTFKERVFLHYFNEPQDKKISHVISRNIFRKNNLCSTLSGPSYTI